MRIILFCKRCARDNPDRIGSALLKHEFLNFSQPVFQRKPADIESVASARPVVPDRPDKPVRKFRRIPLIPEIPSELNFDFLFAGSSLHGDRTRRDAFRFRPACGMQEIEVFHISRRSRNGCGRNSSREVHRLEYENGFPAVLFRTHNPERDIRVNSFFEVKSRAVVLRTLIGPAADAVFFLCICKSHIRRL